jgi:uncharacterized protein YggU (UPF0235/DUF167 family)
MYIRARVFAKAKNESFKRLSGDTFLIEVKEPAEQNRANMRVLDLVASYFDIHSKQVRIISGHHSSGKLLSLPDKKEK